MRAGVSGISGRAVICAVLLVAVWTLLATMASPGQLGALVASTAGAMGAVLVLRWLLPRLGRHRFRLTVPKLRRRARTPQFEDIPVALLRFAIDGALVKANATARDMLGPMARGLFAHDLFEDMGRPISDWISEVASGSHPGGTEVLRLRRSSEADSYTQVTARRLGENEVLAVLQDATAMKRLEAQMTQSQKMQAIGQLAGGIAHDFNNLLTAITGHCDLLLLKHRPDDPDHLDLQQIQQNAYRAGALVRQLLAFSRKQTMVPEVFDLTETLGELKHLLSRLLGGSVRLDLDHASAAVAIRADKRQFEQIIINLAVNARDAMPAGGALCIATERITLTEPMRRDRALVPASTYVVVRVSDTGTGITTDVMDKIFEPFFTTKRAGEGTGLGLSTVYGIVKQSGGYIFVDSVPGEGTEFNLWFPSAKDHQSASAELPDRRPARAAAGGVVLLVEDEAPVRAFAARALRMRGLTVIEADSGEQALALSEQGFAIDLFVTDVVLPGRDGPTWVRQALDRRPGTPVIFMSGYAAEAPSQAQARIANSVFLQKPFSLNDLCDTVFSTLPKRPYVQMPEVLSVS